MRDDAPEFAKEEAFFLRRSNCKSFFPQLADWFREDARQFRGLITKAARALAKALQHIGAYPRGAGESQEVPGGVGAGGR
eukprot:6477359-Alexandrium_andersonii.AAC.1